jgi:2-iminobutanoate/2-iminopropanoate deaminase
MPKTPILTKDAPAPAGSYSQGMAVGPFVYTAGMGPLDPATGAIVGDTIEEQTARAIDNVEAVLIAHGLTLADVVKSTVHLQHLERDFAGYDAVYRHRFSDPFPVRTTVGSNLMGFLVEIDVVAMNAAANE